jgi:hypothetical protein
MDNCQLITDEDTGENVLWRYESEDYSVDGLFEIYKDSINVNLDLKNKIMKQTAVEFISKGLFDILQEAEDNNIFEVGTQNFKRYIEMFLEQAKEMEKQQIIESGNSCAFKQHLHSERINKMSMDELEQYDLEPSYTFGEEYYNETFKNK